MIRTGSSREFADFLDQLDDEDFAGLALGSGMDVVPPRTPAGYFALLEFTASGIFRPNRAGFAQVVRRLRRLPARAVALALAALLRSRRTSRPAPVRIPAPAPVRMTSQRQRSTVAPSRGSPWRVGVGEAPT